jgi:hypothetical protein
MTLRAVSVTVVSFFIVIYMSGCAIDKANPTGPQAPTTGSITLINSSSYTIQKFYISPSTETTFSIDYLGVNVLPAGQSYKVSNLAPGYYDLRVTAVDGSTSIHADQYQILLEAGEALAWTVYSLLPF